MPQKFTYPFRYDPAPEIIEAARDLMARIEASEALRRAFGEGKMLGVLKVKEMDGYLAAFSGVAAGTNKIEGFVPPIYDLLDPEGHFKRSEAEIVAITEKINERLSLGDSGSAELQALKLLRSARSNQLQQWIFSQFVVNNARGETSSIWDIFAAHGLVPPAGTGECAAPKLLQYAFAHNLTPVSMGEFWYSSNLNESDLNESDHVIKRLRPFPIFHPSCSSKCGPLLRWMLQGIEVENPYGFDDGTIPETIYEDEHIVAFNKRAGMLCAPGKDGQVSLPERLDYETFPVNRLDMDTSGIILYAKTRRAQAELRRQFENHLVEKSYIAIVQNNANLKSGERGSIDLPIIPDISNRPLQKVDPYEGRPSKTLYEVLEIREKTATNTALIRFRPITGRTHQIRVHAKEGLGCPILGDLLYGSIYTPRMFLHCESVKFIHPISGKEITLFVPSGF